MATGPGLPSPILTPSGSPLLSEPDVRRALAKVYALDEIVQAHRDMESGAHACKLVVRIGR